MNKKSIGALLLSAALLVGGTASTFAYFTNSAETDVSSFTTGNVKVAFLENQESKWSLVSTTPGRDNDEINVSDKRNATKVAPGDKIKKTFTLQNTGSLDAKVRFSLTGITPAGTANGSGTADNGDWWYSDWEAWRAYTIKDGEKKLVDLKIYNDINHVFAGYAELDASSQETIVVEAYVKVNPLMENGTNNSNFDKTFSFKVNAEATQWNNPGWTEAGN